MSRSFDLNEVATFAAGTVGPTGERVFYLQAVTATQIVSLKVEKQQVALLADFLEQLLANESLPEAQPAHMPGLDMPIDEEWTVGSILVALNRETNQIVVIAEEMMPALDEPDLVETEAAEARFALSRGQVEAFISGARRLVASGRPVCPLCNEAIDDPRHNCPRMN